MPSSPASVRRRGRDVVADLARVAAATAATPRRRRAGAARLRAGPCRRRPGRTLRGRPGREPARSARRARPRGRPGGRWSWSTTCSPPGATAAEAVRALRRRDVVAVARWPWSRRRRVAAGRASVRGSAGRPLPRPRRGGYRRWYRRGRSGPVVPARRRSCSVDVVVSSRHCELSDRFRQHVEEKLARLEKYDHSVAARRRRGDPGAQPPAVRPGGADPARPCTRGARSCVRRPPPRTRWRRSTARCCGCRPGCARRRTRSGSTAAAGLRRRWPAPLCRLRRRPSTAPTRGPAARSTTQSDGADAAPHQVGRSPCSATGRWWCGRRPTRPRR